MRIVAQKFDEKCWKESIMLKEIQKFASETNGPIAMKGTRKHTHG